MKRANPDLEIPGMMLGAKLKHQFVARTIPE